MEFEIEGLWGHITSKAPSIEVPELANLIGFDLINTNSELWRELKAFSSILTEIHTLEFDKPLTSNDRNEGDRKVLPLTQDNLKSVNNKESGNADDVLKLDLSGNRNSKGIVGNNDEQLSEQLTRRSRTSMDSYDIIMSVEECINVSRIDEVVDMLRDAFREEKQELESEIAILYAALDNETDAIATETARNAITSRKKELKHRSLKVDRFSPHGKGGRLDSYDNKERECDECYRMRQSAMPHGPGRIRPKKVFGPRSTTDYSTLLCPNCEAALSEPSQVCDGRGNPRREKSKVRSKFQAAKDEKHFLDDDLF